MEPRWKHLVPELVRRHRVVDLAYYPWFKVPAVVKIAMYAESSIRFNGGSFVGLQRVIAALKSDPWPWVKFDVTLIHRHSDPSADLQNKTLDSIGLDDFDELWLFGIQAGNQLSANELNAVHSFMDKGGGVLHTGDHASLGQGIAGAIKRAGKMRQYPAPPATSGVWNNTLRPGGDAVYSFTDQSDDEPQPIRLKYYSTWSWNPSLYVRKYPHPVLCGKDGPIRIFPDHQHEGEAVAPSSYSIGEWPEENGYQPTVEVIAWGKIEAPDADVGREIGLVSVYNGHPAKVGRIVADSTWHHWFDINLDGFAATVTGQARLATIEQYFLNVAAWLAPSSKQRAMRNGLIIFASWKDPLVMLDPNILRPWVLGGMAKDALGQFAPQCMVRQWLIDFIKPHVLERIRIVNPDPGPERELRVPLPIEDIVMAGAITPVLQHNLDVAQPEEAVDSEFVDRAFAESRSMASRVIEEQSRVYRQLEEVSAILRER